MQHPDPKGTGARGNDIGSSLGSDEPLSTPAPRKIQARPSAVANVKPRDPYPIFWRPDHTAPGTALSGIGGAS